MRWRDRGIVLSMRLLGAGGYLAEIITPAHGRCFGVVAQTLPKISRVDVVWSGREHHQLGRFQLALLDEQITTWPDSHRLSLGLMAVTALLSDTIPTSEPQPALFQRTEQLLLAATLPAASEEQAWLMHYVRWEAQLLEELGYRLMLDACAVTGTKHGLAYVSPVTGRAVTAEIAAPYLQQVLTLPQFLREESDAGCTGCTACAQGSCTQLTDGLALTGHFLRRFALPKGELPHARQMLAQSCAATHSPKRRIAG